MALLTAKVHEKHELQREIELLAEENRKTIKLNDAEVQKIKSESSLLVPLKRVVPGSSKECKNKNF